MATAKPKKTTPTKATKTAKAVSKAKAKTKTQEAAKSKTPPVNLALPMFYRSVVALNLKSHGDLKVKPSDGFKYAKGANSIVLAAAEFPQAAVHYPIVFSKAGGNLQAFAVTGHTDGENVYVDADFKWRADTYIPAYVRRYPFILIQTETEGNFSLGIDDQCSRVNTKTGDVIYNGDEASEFTNRALEFCFAFSKELERSAELLKQIDECDILVERSADVAIDGGEKKSRIKGFSIVDEKKLAELDDDKFLALRKSGALDAIYSHLWSMRSWNNLLG